MRNISIIPVQDIIIPNWDIFTFIAVRPLRLDEKEFAACFYRFDGIQLRSGPEHRSCQNKP